MHPAIYSLLALDLAKERTAEAERRARLFRGAGPVPRTLSPRVMRWLAAAASAASVALRRRADGSTAPLA